MGVPGVYGSSEGAREGNSLIKCVVMQALHNVTSCLLHLELAKVAFVYAGSAGDACGRALSPAQHRSNTCHRYLGIAVQF